MTKKITATQIEGYKRNAILEKFNKIKNNQPKITMKFYSAALLAIGAVAVKLQEGDSTKPPKKEGGEGGQGGEGGEGGDDRGLPFPAPDCPPKPSEEEMKNATDMDIFNKIDVSGNGAISEQEGFNGLYCMVEYGMMEEDAAIFMYEWLGEHVDGDKDGVMGELDASEMEHALKALKELEK